MGKDEESGTVLREQAKRRVELLVGYLKRFRKHLLDDKGEPSPAALAKQTGKAVTYWSDVLRIPNGAERSFAAAAARMAEAKLDMPSLYLEGGGWPFEDVDQARYERLNEKRKGRVQQAVIATLDQIEREMVERGEVTLAGISLTGGATAGDGLKLTGNRFRQEGSASQPAAEAGAPAESTEPAQAAARKPRETARKDS